MHDRKVSKRILLKHGLLLPLTLMLLQALSACAQTEATNEPQ
jgi:hypothetical protein